LDTARPLPGTVLLIPATPEAPRIQRRAIAAPADEVAVVIGGVRFRYWTEVEVTQSLDAFDTFRLLAPMEPGNVGFRNTFRPFAFTPVTVLDSGAPLITGTMVGVEPSSTPESRTVTASGYSLPGVLADCTTPHGADLDEYDGQTLAAIAAAVCRPFGLSVTVDGMGGAFDDIVSIKTGQTVYAFLSELARQKGGVVTDTPAGGLRIGAPVAPPRTPVARFIEGEPGAVEIVPNFTPQQYFSHITALASASTGDDGAAYTVKNPQLAGVLRPHTFTAPDTDGGDVEQAARAKTGRMFGNAAQYTVTVPSWRDAGGNRWRPGSLVTVYAPGAMIYREYDLEIRAVRFTAREDAKTATLTLCIPGAFRGELPEHMPWDG